MALYCMADTHLSESVSKPMDLFGRRWVNYTAKIAENWNAVVREEDTVILPGDISWGLTLDEAEADLAFLHRLNGRKLIGKGNHDLWWQSDKKVMTLIEERGFSSLSLLRNNAYALEGKRICGSRGWYSDPHNAPPDTDFSKITAREVIRAEISIRAALSLPAETQDDELIAFFHFPPVYRGFVCRDLIELMKRYGIKRCYYGHIHNVYDLPPSFEFEGITMTIVSADYLNFMPLRIV